MIKRIQKWRFKKIAKKVSLALKGEYGEKKSYTSIEIENVFHMVKLSGKQSEYAYAMFASENDCNEFLIRVGISQTAKELRDLIGEVMFGSSSAVSYESAWTRFHDYNNKILGNLKSPYNSNRRPSDPGFQIDRSGGYGGHCGGDG